MAMKTVTTGLWTRRPVQLTLPRASTVTGTRPLSRVTFAMESVIAICARMRRSVESGKNLLLRKVILT